MKNDEIKKQWESILLVLIVFISGIIVLLDFVGVLDSVEWLSTRIPTITLLLLGSVAGYLILERRSMLTSMQESIDSGFERTFSAIGGVKIEHVSGQESGFEHLIQAINGAKSRIALVSLAPALHRNTPFGDTWESAINDILLENKVQFLYVFNRDSNRINRVMQHLSNNKINKFYPGYFEYDPSIPMSGFAVIDNREVVLTLPTTFGEPQIWITIEHPDLVNAYQKYFDRLWGDATHIENENSAKALLSNNLDVEICSTN